MSPLVARLEAAGFTLHATPDHRLVVEHPGAPPTDLLDEIRAHRDELLAELAQTCLDCARPVPPSDFFCGDCYRARQATGRRRVVALADYRRARTAARLAGTRCFRCKTDAWTFTPTGDAYCGRCHPDGGAA